VSKPRRTLKTYGERGRSARVFLERGHAVVRVQWRVRGQVKTESFPNTAEGKDRARQFAQGVVEALEARSVPARVTVAELWGKYAEAELTNLRPRTFALNADAWRKWELFVGREKVAEDLGVESLAGLKAHLERDGLAVNTIARVIRGVKVVYNWGEAHELLARNKTHRFRFKVGKDRKPGKVAEYRKEDFLALCAALPLDGRNWRAGGIVRLCGYQGVRQGAVRHLRWEDLNFDTLSVTWRASYDKLGREWRQPLRQQTWQILEEIRVRGIESPWVFPAPRERKSGDPVYSAQALWWALTEAEKRAGIPHLPNRGAHGLRRMLAGDIMALTGNLKTAGDAIGDKDLRVLQEHYLSDRDDQVREAFALLDGPETATETVTEDGSGGMDRRRALATTTDGNDLDSKHGDEGGGTRTHDLAYKGKNETAPVQGNLPRSEPGNTPALPPKRAQSRNPNRNATVTGQRPRGAR
jgi:integrase